MNGFPKDPPKAFLKEFPNLRDFWPFVHHLNNESPRGMALISTGYLEQLLEDMLRAFMVEGAATEELFSGGNAPLGSFSARSKAAFALGLITVDELHDLNLLRYIRNRYAHHVRASFDDKEIKDRCANLKHKAHDYTTADDKQVRVSPQGQFATAATGLILNMVNRAHYIAEKRLTYGQWPR